MGKIAKKADNHTYIYKIKCFHLVDKYMVITGRETEIQFAPVQYGYFSGERQLILLINLNNQ